MHEEINRLKSTWYTIFSSVDHQNIEANHINLNTVDRSQSMYRSMIEFRAKVKNDVNSLIENLNDSVMIKSQYLSQGAQETH